LILINATLPFAELLLLQQGYMRILDFLQGTLAKVTSIGAALRKHSDFACGDCERVDRCGLPPSDDCIEKAAQIERGWHRSTTRASWP
jgi:hypothetical protein